MLEQTGVFVEDDEALDIFADGGAASIARRAMVRIPGEVVEAAIAACPHGRGRAGDASATSTRASCTSTRAAASGASRARPTPPTRRCWSTRSPTSTATPPRSGRPTCPAATAAVHGCEAALLNTAKPVGAEATSGWEVRVCAELGACIVGGLDALRDEPGRELRHLPGEPAQAAARRHRGDRRVRASRPVGLHPLDGDGRRLGAGHPRRHAGDAQRRGARRHHPGAAHRARRAGHLRHPRRRPWTCATPPPRWARPSSP